VAQVDARGAAGGRDLRALEALEHRPSPLPRPCPPSRPRGARAPQAAPRAPSHPAPAPTLRGSRMGCWCGPDVCGEGVRL
jgi:hypothetical protein